MSFSEKLPLSLRKSRAKVYQFAPLWMVFDVEVDLRRKSRLVIGGEVINSSGHEVYERTTKSVSAKILMTIATTNNLNVMTGDIHNTYLNANTEENI